MLKVEKDRNEIIFEKEWGGDLEEAGRIGGKSLVHMTLELRQPWHLLGFQVMKARDG
ncbi:MAG: hypothetical protein ACXABV_09445 [Candidatus Thorarchaeota archaeon]|jgi:hypothetical protein